jgi:hypothetical protein
MLLLLVLLLLLLFLLLRILRHYRLHCRLHYLLHRWFYLRKLRHLRVEFDVAGRRLAQANVVDATFGTIKRGLRIKGAHLENDRGRADQLLPLVHPARQCNLVIVDRFS